MCDTCVYGVCVCTYRHPQGKEEDAVSTTVISVYLVPLRWDLLLYLKTH